MTTIAATKKIARLGILLGITVALSALESLFALPFLPPNMKPGFANVVVMYAAFALDAKSAITLNALKAVFVFTIRGAMAGALSFAGGMLSIIIILALLSVRRASFSYIFISVSGAISHNLGQFLVISIWFNAPEFMYYTPFILASGVIFGVLTGSVLRALMPLLEKIAKPEKKV